MTTLLELDPEVLANAWLLVDPDPKTRAETERLLEFGGDDLRVEFTDRLAFGTAGLRGPMGTGPRRMNRVLVRVVADSIASRLADDVDPHVVVGYDARHESRNFAEDTARVFAARGVRCRLMPRALPTPLVPYAIRHYGASAGVMVTASHNPAADNGYKVYWGDGAQLGPPLDREISELIDRTHLLRERDLAPLDHPDISVVSDDLIESYIQDVVGLLDPGSRRTARVAYTPLHGVGAGLIEQAFACAGFPAPSIVPGQELPDPDFPSVAFPNPEEPGAVDALIELASEVHADVAFANDPDADRLAVAVPNGPAWRLLTGDELGSLIAEHLLRRPNRSSARRLVVNTVVSSRLLSRIAAHHGADHAESLTGFKWILQTRNRYPEHDLVLGYEEALGYAVGDVVADKDGVSAALVVAELVSELAADGKTLLDLLDEIHLRHGVYVNGQRSLRFETTAEPKAGSVMTTAMDALRQRPLSHIAGREVGNVVDLAAGAGDLAPTDAIVVELDHARIVIRPSGTEPKLKIYGEVDMSVDGGLETATVEARALLTALLDDVARVVATPEVADVGTYEDLVDGETVVARRAEELFADTPTGAARANDLRTIVRCIDLTTLEGDDTPGRVRALCSQARRPDPADPTVGPTAAVCVYPLLVGLASGLLEGTPVQVASVAGAFPTGLSALDVRLSDIRAAVTAGADEIDIVLNRSAFLSGRSDVAAEELRASRSAASDSHLKVILEVGDLGSMAAIRCAAQLAIDAGADFIKTSTGKTKSNATPSSVLVMAETIADHFAATGDVVGIKIAGGVRTAEDALGYVAIVRGVLGDSWITPDRLRFGASSLVAGLVNDLVATERQMRNTAELR